MSVDAILAKLNHFSMGQSFEQQRAAFTTSATTPRVPPRVERRSHAMPPWPRYSNLSLGNNRMMAHSVAGPLREYDVIYGQTLSSSSSQAIEVSAGAWSRKGITQKHRELCLQHTPLQQGSRAKRTDEHYSRSVSAADVRAKIQSCPLSITLMSTRFNHLSSWPLPWACGRFCINEAANQKRLPLKQAQSLARCRPFCTALCASAPRHGVKVWPLHLMSTICERCRPRLSSALTKDASMTS